MISPTEAWIVGKDATILHTPMVGTLGMSFPARANCVQPISITTNSVGQLVCREAFCTPTMAAKHETTE